MNAIAIVMIAVVVKLGVIVVVGGAISIIINSSASGQVQISEWIGVSRSSVRR